MGNKYIYFFDLLSSENGKMYVGSTINIDKRLRDYNRPISTRLVTNTINKYGFKNFYKLIINLGDVSKEDMLKWEKFYIALFGTYNYDNKNGLNIIQDPTIAFSKEKIVSKNIALSRKGMKLSEKHKESIRNGTKGINKGKKRPYLAERNKIVKPTLGRTGEKHPMSKKVLYVPENKIFYSFKDCADYICVSRTTIRNRVLSNHKDFKLI